MLTEVTRLLASIAAPGAFATRRTDTADDLHLEVKGVGRIRLPLPPAKARQLCAVGRPARYGLRDQTLLDRQVRDGWEIRKSQIKIDHRRWTKTLTPRLEEIRRDLGLAKGRKLRAELHNMLVYGPGQFFAPHQDSEKTDDMIGTLVVMLPSTFEGGAIVVEHHGAKVTFRGSSEELTFVAFYADCHHQVRPVKSGHRAVLTYNLVLDDDADRGLPARAVDLPAKQLDALVQQVRGHFEMPLPQRWQPQERGQPPDRLVYLLDHQYTQKGLSWHRLKNGDAARAAALRAVAARLGCEIFLALADVHESWSCEDDDYDDYWRRGRRWSDDDVTDDDPDGHTLVELFDSSIVLRHWIDSSGRQAEAIEVPVDDDEICFTKASVELEPFRSEHEGYMGNYGNTVDRWYHRAAVVLWPHERTFVIRAKAAAAWAVREVSRTLDAGQIDEARTMAERLLPFWGKVARREAGRDFMNRTLRVAVGLEASELAAALVEPLQLERFTPRTAPHCIALVDRYGLEWCRTMFERWASQPASDERKAWLASLPDPCGPLCAESSGNGRELARWLVKTMWAWVREEAQEIREHFPPRQAIDPLCGLSKPILGVLESSVMAESPEVTDQIVAFLTSTQDEYPPRCSVHLLRTARGLYPPARLAALGLATLHEHCTRALAARLSTPPRAHEDWSIPFAGRCTCELCQTLVRFLAAHNETRFEWPLAQERRAHIHRLLDDHDLPVKHETRRRGRPYTLVLTKTKTLFEREAVERKSWQAELAWLTKEAKSFGPRATTREARAVAAAARPRARNPGARRRPGSDRARRSARS